MEKDDTSETIDWRAVAPTTELTVLESLALTRGANLDPQWWQKFGDAEKKALLGSFLAGGLTPLGLSRMKPGDLALASALNLAAAKLEIEFRDRVKNVKGGNDGKKQTN